MRPISSAVTRTSSARGWADPATILTTGHRGTPWWNFLTPHLVHTPIVAGWPLRMVMYSTFFDGVLTRHRGQYMMAGLAGTHTGDLPF